MRKLWLLGTLVFLPPVGHGSCATLVSQSFAHLITVSRQATRSLQLPYTSREVTAKCDPAWVLLVTERERQAYRVSFQDGLAVDADGVVLPEGEYMFVMDRRGAVYARPERVDPDPFHHMSFLNAGPSAASGTFFVGGGDMAGRIHRITDDAGSYMPQDWQMEQFVTELQFQGVDLSHATIRYRMYFYNDYWLDYGFHSETFDQPVPQFLQSIVARSLQRKQDFLRFLQSSLR